MCVCLRETEEKGTDWYSEGKDAAEETSEVTVIFGENSSRPIINRKTGQ